MTSAISAAALPPAILSSANAQPKPAPAASTAPSAQDTAVLNDLMNRYQADLSQDLPVNTLSTLGQQIMAAAMVADQHVVLPRAMAPAAPAGVPAAGVPPTVNVTA